MNPDLLDQLQDATLLRGHLGDLSPENLALAQSAVRFVLDRLSDRKLAIIPKEPSQALLMSMAIRSDHGLGCPGYYDQALLGGKEGDHVRRVESALRSMSQLHEEVVGEGFYSPQAEDRYRKLLPPSLTSSPSV